LSSTKADPSTDDIIDEAITLFRANCLFRNFEIKGNAGRVLIYLILFISECLHHLNKTTPHGNALKNLSTLAVSNFSIPGDPSFPLNAMYQTPSNRLQAGKYKWSIRLDIGPKWMDISIVFISRTHTFFSLCYINRRSNAAVYPATSTRAGPSSSESHIHRWSPK
jgi:actin related protein 2/3 complex subunit 3